MNYHVENAFRVKGSYLWRRPQANHHITLTMFLICCYQIFHLSNGYGQKWLMNRWTHSHHLVSVKRKEQIDTAHDSICM